MKIHKPKIIVSLVIVLLAAGILTHFFLAKKSVVLRSKDGYHSRPKEAGDHPLSHAVAEKNTAAAILEAFSAPIELYGKVVDQFGDPVSGAYVDLTPASSFYGEGPSNHQVLTTDSKGEFSIEGLKGFSMGVRARKRGYLQYPPLDNKSSTVNLGYPRNENTGDSYESPANPLILHLLKVMSADPTIYVENKLWKLPVDGTPQIIALDSEKGVGTHQIEVRFSSDWNKLPMDNEINSKLFDWSLEIRIPGGGFVWDRSDANFEAPETGYKERIRYEYSANMPREKWKRIRKGRYFVKFADGTYGRVQFEIDGGSDSVPLLMQSWLSLKPGSRKLGAGNMIIKVIESESPEGGSTNE